jgi:hypothetical protein
MEGINLFRVHVHICGNTTMKPLVQLIYANKNDQKLPSMVALRQEDGEC